MVQYIFLKMKSFHGGRKKGEVFAAFAIFEAFLEIFNCEDMDEIARQNTDFSSRELDENES